MDYITIDGIKDFQICARLYDYRYQTSEHEAIYSRQLYQQRLTHTLKKVMSFFFYKRQSGVLVTYASLLKRWERLWFPKNMTPYDLAVEQHEVLSVNNTNATTFAARALMNFYEHFSNDNSVVFAIDEEFIVPIRENVILEDRIDLILRSPQNQFRVFKWSTERRRPPESNYLLDFAAYEYALRHKYDQELDVDYVLYNPGDSKSHYARINVEEDDIDTLLYWANAAIDTEVYMPRRGLTSYCKKCPFDKPCSQFSLNLKKAKK